MQTPTRSQHPFWSVVPLEAIACAVVFLVGVLAPLQRLDDLVNGQLLVALGRSEPPASVILLMLDDVAIRDGCAGRLTDALQRGGAKGALVVPPAQDLCRIADSIGGRRPVAALPRGAVRTTAGGYVVGWVPRAADRATLAAFGIEKAPWVAPRSFQAIPAVPLSEVTSGRVPEGALRQRIAVVAIEEPMWSVGVGRGPFANRVAAAVAAAVEDRPRRHLASGFTALGTTVLAALLLLVARSRWRAPFRLIGSLVPVGGALGFVGAGLLGHGYLLGIPSAVLALGSGLSLAALPPFLAARRADAAARRMLHEIAELGPASTTELADSEFWASLPRRVAQVHPAEGVLVAELPASAWRLRVHPNGDLTEAIISERRRDIRRTPFTDESGARRPHVHRGFVAMKDVPTVLVPLEAQGEPEGYLCLIGQSAEQAFLQHPEVTQRIADDLAHLIRHRRLARHRAAEWRRPGGLDVETTMQGATSMVDGARGALHRLALAHEVIAAAPVGLVHADAFGDVRLMSEAFRRLYLTVGGTAPAPGAGGNFPPGVLTLAEVLDVLTRAGGQAALHLEALPEEPVSFVVIGSHREPPTDSALLVAVRRFVHQDVPGTIVSLVEAAGASTIETSSTNIERLPDRGDPLVVFSLAQLLRDVVDDVSRRTQGRIKLQTPRILAHVVGHRRELTAALVDFLTEAAGADGKRSAPILTLKERQYRIELTIMDVQLGAPTGAVRRTLLAPSQPPPGLLGLGALTRAVENSHGSVAFRQEEGWGIRLTASLVRARPRVEPEPAAAVVALPPAARIPEKKP
ncbi:MAG: hypothetical protein JW751_16685 [Polyangiaceae bacterium]|nr:hypothetical protein [Polyangiaceae bacterium]